MFTFSCREQDAWYTEIVQTVEALSKNYALVDNRSESSLHSDSKTWIYQRNPRHF